MKGKIKNPRVASLLGIYTLAKELHISPVEAYSLPASFVRDLLIVHTEIETYKGEEIEKVTSKTKSQMNKISKR